MRILFLFISFFTLSFSSIILTNETKQIHDFKIEYLFDASKNLTINEISKKDFKSKIDNRFAFGYIKGNNWFKLNLLNKGDNQRFILHLNEALFENVNFYRFTKNSWQNEKNGFIVGIDEKKIKDVAATFEINIKKGEEKTYYIQAYTKFSNLGEFQLYEYDTFVMEHKSVLQSMYTFYFGMLTIIIIFTLYLYYKFKERIYIYYVGYTFFFALFVSIFSGNILYLGLEQWHYYFHIAPPLFLLFLLLFSNEFLKIDVVLPITYKVLKFLVFVFCILAFLILIDVEPWYEVTNFFATFVFLLLIYASFITMKKGNQKSKYYLFAISVYMITILFMSSMVNGWFPYNDFNRYAYLYGSCFEIIFFSLMLVNRFYESQNEKIKISNELIEIKEKREVYLKQEVENRSNKINEMDVKLYNILQDKELLLKELYHRVKNNFQMLISLLWIESTKIEDKKTQDSFEDLTNRIKSMSFIHDYLYSSINLSQIKSDEYMFAIVEHVKNIYTNNSVIVKNDIDSIKLSHEQAIALGSILNEVLNNSIKHHKDKNKCLVDIYFRNYDKKCLLTIQDNGEGFDTESLSGGLGLGLIEQFGDKLKNSRLLFVNNSGTRFELSFEQE